MIKYDKQKHKTLIGSFFSLSILNGINVLLPLITLPYILRVVGSANYGIYSYVYVLIQYLLLFNAYGFNLSATKQIVENRTNQVKLNNIFVSVVACRLILLLLGLIIFGTLSPLLFDNTTEWWMFVMGLGIVLGDSFNSIWLFQGMEKMHFITIVNVIPKALFTVLIFVFIRNPEDYKYILLFNSLGFLIAGIMSTVIANRKFGIKFVWPSWQGIKFQLKDGLALFGTSVGTNLYGNASVFILNFFVNDHVLGLFAAAEKIIKGLQSLTLPITQALFPYLGFEFIGKSAKYKIERIKKTAKSISLLLFIPTLLVFLGADIIIRLFCGPGFEQSALLLRIMTPILFFGTLNYVLGIIGMINLNKQKLFFVGVLIAGLVNIVMLVGLTPRWGIVAASTSVPFSEIFLFVFCTISLIKVGHKQVE